MGKWLIPDDWDGVTWEQFVMCVPSSTEWIGNVKGAVYELSRQYNWEGESEAARSASATGMEVFESIMACNLIEAINGIKVALEMSGCCIPPGQGEDNEAGEEGGSVPSPIGTVVYEEPSPISDRKCKASNLIHESLRDAFFRLDEAGADKLGVLGLTLAASVVAAVFATFVASPIAGVIVLVAGSLAAFVARLIGVTVVLEDIWQIMDDNEQALICAFYSSTNVTSAREMYLDILELGGLGSAELGLVSLLMYNSLLNVLFFDTLDTAAFWPIYSGPVDCDACTPEECLWDFVNGTFGTGNLDIDSQPRTLTSVPNAGAHIIQITLPAGSCFANRELSVIGVAGWTNVASYSNDFLCDDGVGGYNFVYDNSSTGDPPPVGILTGAILRMASSTAFTANVRLLNSGVKPPC
jgi:hypothetical protein